MPPNSPIFDVQQLADELLGRYYLLPTEIEVYVRNLVRIMEEQSHAIKELQRDVLILSDRSV